MENAPFFRFFRVATVLIVGAVGNCATPAAEPGNEPPYRACFDPVQGFKPAPPNLTTIFLQLAGSLEHFGSPEPFIRHAIAEATSADALYERTKGKPGFSRPTYLTDAYVDNLIAGWNKLSPALKLDGLCRTAGRNMRYAIRGGWNKTVPELVEQETSLTEAEKASYRRLLQKQYFAKADFPAMETFYKAAFDKLTEEGKDQISARTKRGTLPPTERAKAIQEDQGGTMLITLINQHQAETVAFLESGQGHPVNSDNLEAALKARLKLGETDFDWSNLPPMEREAFKYCQPIRAAFAKRLEFVRTQSNTPEQAKNAETVLVSMLENLVVIAHAEFLAALSNQPSK